MSEPIYINDGMERGFRISRVPGIHGELTGARRIMTDEQVQQYKRKTTQYHERNQSAAAERLRNSTIAEQLVEWSIDKPITADHVARIHPVVLSKLEGVVCGVSPDGTEDLDDDQPDDRTDREITATTTGN